MDTKNTTIIKKWAKWTLVFISLFTIAHAYNTSQLKFKYDFNDFFPKSDSAYSFFENHVERFGKDNNYIMLAIKNNAGIFDIDFLTKVKRLNQELSQIDSITNVFSPLEAKSLIIQQDPIFRTEVPFEIPFFHLDQPQRIKKDSIYIYTHPEMIGTIISKDAKSILLLINITDDVKEEVSTKLVASIQQHISKYKFDETHLAGKTIAETSYISRMLIELAIFVSCGLILLIFFLYIAFRSTWGIILPLTVVLLSVIWTMGSMSLLGNDLDIMSLMIPTIIFVVGMSDVIHLTSKYLDELRSGLNKEEALGKTLKEVGLATLLTSITTALGFVTLLFTEIRPIQFFGIHTAIGVMLAYLLAFTFYPAILYLLPPPVSLQKRNNSYWTKRLHQLFLWTLNHRKIIMIFYILITGLSIWGASKISNTAYLIDEVSDKDPLKKNFEYMSENFSGGRPFELSIKVKEGKLYTPKVLKSLAEIEKLLDSTFYLKNPRSILSVAKSLNRAYNGGNQLYYSLPKNKRNFRKISQKLKLLERKGEIAMLVDKEGHYLRLMGNVPDMGSSEFQSKKLLFENIKSQYPNLELTITGSADLIDKSNIYLSQDMIKGLFVAFIAVALIMGLLFKSIQAIIISLIPNIIPLLMIAGVMGFLGIRLNISTAIIFTIAFGIAVDDTIHFMSKFKLQLSKGYAVAPAIKTTFLTTGKAIIVTSIILVAGFCTLMLSSFNGMRYTGFLISLTLIFAVLSDLLLIPLLIIYLYPKNKKTNS